MKILTTIGPLSDRNKLNFFVKNSDLLRLNLSHNTISWHKKTSNKIKEIDDSKMILLDIPGIKPRTLNSENLKIIKGERYSFSYKNKLKIKNLIEISNPIPNIKRKPKSFLYQMVHMSLKNQNLKKI